MFGKARGPILLAAVLAPTAGVLAITVALVLFAWIRQPVEDIFGGLQETIFYLLLFGAGGAYLVEFLGIWYFRHRTAGRGLPLPALLLVSSLLGGVISPVVVHFVIPLETAMHWIGIGALGAFGGLVSGVTFWAVAPEVS